MTGTSRENPAREPQKAAPSSDIRPAGGEGASNPRSFQRLVATGMKRGRPPEHPRFRRHGSDDWHAVTTHPLYELARGLHRQLFAYVDDVLVPGAWLHPKHGAYNLLRDILDFLPPRPHPGARTWVRVRHEGGRVQLYWRARFQDHLHQSPHFLFICCYSSPFLPEREPLEWTTVGMKGPIPPSWGHFGYDLPTESDPAGFVWNPEALPGDPAHLIEPTRYVPESEERCGLSISDVLAEMIGPIDQGKDDAILAVNPREGVTSMTENEPLQKMRIGSAASATTTFPGLTAGYLTTVADQVRNRRCNLRYVRRRLRATYVARAYVLPSHVAVPLLGGDGQGSAGAPLGLSENPSRFRRI